MELLEELKAKEAEIMVELKPLRERHRRLTIELAMARHGILALTSTPGKRGRKGRLPEEVLDEAEAMRGTGVPWVEVAMKVGTTVAAIQKAVERRKKGNQHLKAHQ